MVILDKDPAIYGRPMTEQEVALHQKKGAKFSDKYRKGLKTVVRITVREILEKQPDMPLTVLLATVFEDFNPELTSDLVRDVFEYTIAEWEAAQLQLAQELDEVLA
jgi:hypothetical protein